MKCEDCGMDGLYWWQIHYPGNDPENGPAHAPATYRRCWHCAEPAREDSDFCQNHYVLDINMRRDTLLCNPCRFAQTYGKMWHELCEGCQCTDEGTECDPYHVNSRWEYDHAEGP